MLPSQLRHVMGERAPLLPLRLEQSLLLFLGHYSNLVVHFCAGFRCPLNWLRLWQPLFTLRTPSPACLQLRRSAISLCNEPGSVVVYAVQPMASCHDSCVPRDLHRGLGRS